MRSSYTSSLLQRQVARHLQVAEVQRSQAAISAFMSGMITRIAAILGRPATPGSKLTHSDTVAL